SLISLNQLFGSSTALAAGRPHIQRPTIKASTAASTVLSKRRNRGGKAASDRRSLSIFPVLPMDQRPGRGRSRPTGGYRRLAQDGNVNSLRIWPHGLEGHGAIGRQASHEPVGRHFDGQCPVAIFAVLQIHTEIIGSVALDRQ